jgi:ABC-type transport system involved in cytochrome bd biosynthesis fused ATPase/permease subunit
MIMDILVMLVLALCALYASIRFSAAVLSIVVCLVAIILAGGVFWAMFILVSLLA